MIAPSQMEPRDSGLYRIVRRNSPLSASGKSKAQKSHRVTLSRFVESTSTKPAKVQLGCHAVRNFQKQAQPVAFMPQLLFVHVPLNCDPGDVAGILDQLQVVGAGTARFTIKDGKSAEDFPFAREQGTRPNGTNSIRQTYGHDNRPK